MTTVQPEINHIKFFLSYLMVHDQKSTRHYIFVCLYFGFLNMTVWITIEYDCSRQTKKYEPESEEAMDKL